MEERRLNLGDRAKDTISGFTGIITGRYEYLHGCVQISLTPESLDKDGKVFDEAQVELVEAGAKPGAAVRRNEPRPPGGPERVSGERVLPPR